MSIGDKVRATRKAAGISQEEVARRAGVSLNVINRLERGVILDPHFSTLRGIASALGVPVEDLVREPALAGKAEAPAQGPPAQAAEYWSMLERLAEGLAEGYGIPVEDLLEVPEVALALAGEAETPDQGPASPGRTSRTKVPGIRVPRVGTRRVKASRNRTPELLLEQLHEHGVQTNRSEVSILSQIIGISDELVEEEPVEWEQIGWLLAYTLAYDMLTQDEIEAARAALRREVVESA